MAKMDRRQFLSRVSVAIVGGISALMGIPAAAYLIGPAKIKSAFDERIALGSASKVPLGEPTLFKATLERQTGWVTQTQELAFYVLTEDGTDFIAMSNVCTHLGCRVRWIENEVSFFCPCHNAVFAKDGTVESGPPPRALERYQIEVLDDQLFVTGGEDE